MTIPIPGVSFGLAASLHPGLYSAHPLRGFGTSQAISDHCLCVTSVIDLISLLLLYDALQINPFDTHVLANCLKFLPLHSLSKRPHAQMDLGNEPATIRLLFHSRPSCHRFVRYGLTRSTSGIGLSGAAVEISRLKRSVVPAHFHPPSLQRGPVLLGFPSRTRIAFAVASRSAR